MAVHQRTVKGAHEIPSYRIALHFAQPWFDLRRIADSLRRVTLNILRGLKTLAERGNA